MLFSSNKTTEYNEKSLFYYLHCSWHRFCGAKIEAAGNTSSEASAAFSYYTVKLR